LPASRWTLLAQQVPLMRLDRNPDPAILGVNMDKWDGAPAARDRLLNAVQHSALRNLVVVDGDVHLNCAGEIRKDFADAKSKTLGVEFVVTSISSDGDGFDMNNRFKRLIEQDPHIRFYNSQRGYVRHTVTPERWQADYQVLDKVSTRDGRMSTRKSFVVESGNPKLLDA
jgi:alkaline phosphatase D